MPLESRSRMVSFRLTLEEYERFRQLCLTRGLPNVSELVRSAVNHLIAEPDSALLHTRALESRLTDLEGRLQDLSLVVEGLSRPGSQLTARHEQGRAQSAAGL